VKPSNIDISLLGYRSPKPDDPVNSADKQRRFERQRKGQEKGSEMPSDIDPQSGFRLPLPKREDLDDAGKRAFDQRISAL